MSRPFDRRSRVIASRASFHGRRRAGGVTTAPSRTRSVRIAMAAITTHGSYIVHRSDCDPVPVNTPSQPAPSARAASSAAVRGSPVVTMIPSWIAMPRW